MPPPPPGLVIGQTRGTADRGASSGGTQQGGLLYSVPAGEFLLVVAPPPGLLVIGQSRETADRGVSSGGTKEF